LCRSPAEEHTRAPFWTDMTATKSTTTPAADIAKFFIEIAAGNLIGEQLTARKLKKLKHVLHALTVASAAVPGCLNYRTHIDYVGYLIRHVDGMTLFIPFHLGRFFPHDEIVRDLARAAQALSLTPRDPICLSGSATFLGATRSISDLDF